MCGEVFTHAEAPALPTAGVAILLEAPAFAELGRWASPPPGCVTLLAGWVEDWRSAPDILYERPRAAPIFARYLDLLAEAGETGSTAVTDAMLIAASGVDFLCDALRRGAAPPFATSSKVIEVNRPVFLSARERAVARRGRS